MFCGIRHPASHTQALAKRPSRYVDKIQPRGWVSFKVGVYVSKVEKVGGWEETSLGPSSVEDGGCMSFRQDKPGLMKK